jgi:hypothetical protein
MCKHHQKGWCDRGDQCTFAHSTDELVQPPHSIWGRPQETGSASSGGPQPLIPPAEISGPCSSSGGPSLPAIVHAPVAKARPGATVSKRTAIPTVPTAAEGERRKQLRLQHPADVPGPGEGKRRKLLRPQHPAGVPGPGKPTPEEPDGPAEPDGPTPLDRLVCGWRWREGECMATHPSTTCVAVLPHNGPLVWLSTQADVEDLDLDGPCWMVNAGVIVRCDCDKAVVSLGGMYQVFAPFLTSKPSCCADIDSMMPVMYNTCIQVQCVRQT